MAASAESIKLRGWRQGSLLLVAGELRDQLRWPDDPIQLGDEDLLVCITQTCDLVHHSFEAEPTVDFLRFVPSQAENKGIQHGRHPRRVQVRITADENSRFYETSFRERLFLPREYLAGSDPLTARFLPRQKLDILVRWLGKRYARTAYPDAFNNRLRQKSSQLNRWFKTHHHRFREALIRLQSYEELPDNEFYAFDLLMVAYDAYAMDADLQAALKRVEEIFNSCAGISLRNVDIRAESRTSLKLRDDYTALDYDHLSFRDEELPTV